MKKTAHGRIPRVAGEEVLNVCETPISPYSPFEYTAAMSFLLHLKHPSVIIISPPVLYLIVPNTSQLASKDSTALPIQRILNSTGRTELLYQHGSRPPPTPRHLSIYLSIYLSQQQQQQNQGVTLPASSCSTTILFRRLIHPLHKVDYYASYFTRKV